VKARDLIQPRPELIWLPGVCNIESAIMKAILYAQLNPQKTLEQFVSDRNLYRFLIVAVLIISACG
jgi:hypothetical protein